MRHALRVTLGLIPLLLAAPRLGAQTVPSPFRYIEEKQSVSAFGGYLSTDAGDQDIGPRSAPIFGARYHYRFAGPVGGEIGLGVAPTQRTVYTRSSATGQAVTLTPLGDADMFLVIAEAGLRFYLTGPRTWHGLAPFVAGSGGLASDLAGVPEVEKPIAGENRFDFGPSFAVSLAAGTDWFLAERLSVRVEARDYLWRLTAPASFGNTGRRENEWTRNLGLTLGAALHF